MTREDIATERPLKMHDLALSVVRSKGVTRLEIPRQIDIGSREARTCTQGWWLSPGLYRGAAPNRTGTAHRKPLFTARPLQVSPSPSATASSLFLQAPRQ